MSDPQWAPDPTGRHEYRWYDGTTWTDRVADHGEEAVDPVAAPGPPTASTPSATPPAAMPMPPTVGGPVVTVPEGVWLSSRGRRFLGSLLTVVLMIVTLIIGYVIWTLILWPRGQTPAKQIMGMRILDARTGQVASFGTMFVRNFLLDTVLGGVTGIYGLISALWIFGNDQNQRLTDKIVSTIVVDDPQNRLA